MGEETKINQSVDDSAELISARHERLANGMTPEHENIVHRLGVTQKGREILNDSQFVEYLMLSSARLEQTSGAIEDNGERLTELTGHDLYYSIPSFVGGDGRRPILEAAAAKSHEEIGESTGDAVKLLKTKRRLASIYEELSQQSSQEESVVLANTAIELNEQVAGANDVDLATSPRRFHSLFSTIDIKRRHLLDARVDKVPGESVKTDGELSDRLLELQLETFTALRQAARVAREAEWEEISGSVGDIAFMLVFNDLVRAVDMHGDVAISQGFIRQDHTGYEVFEPGTKVPKWRCSFDLVARDLRSSSEMFVEVKKRRNGSNGTIGRNSYLPFIEVVQFKLGATVDDYLKNIELYSSGRERMINGLVISSEQDDAINLVERVISPEVDRVIDRLNDNAETWRNYASEKHRYLPN